MSPRLSPRAALLAAAAAMLLACSSTPPPTGFRPTSLAESPEEFSAMRAILVRLARAREAKDAAGARAMHPEVLKQGRELLKMAPPADLRRERVPRFLEGRGSFGDAINAFDRAVRGTEDAPLWRAEQDLEGTFWGWYDAYRGRPSEGPV